MKYAAAFVGICAVGALAMLLLIGAAFTGWLERLFER